MALFGEQVVYRGESPFGHYQIVDMTYNGRLARVLFGDSRSSQSGIARDDNPEMLFDYNQRFLEIAESIHPKRVLVIGGGAFTLPKVLIERFAEVAVDVVEIDPLLPQLARDFFDLPLDARLKIFTMDGVSYLHQNRTKYDLIVLDAFSGYTIPAELLSSGAIAAYQRSLAPHGIMAINFIASTTGRKTALANQLWTSFSDAFPAVTIYPADANYPMWAEQNLIFVAGTRPLTDLHYVQSVQVSLGSE